MKYGRSHKEILRLDLKKKDKYKQTLKPLSLTTTFVAYTSTIIRKLYPMTFKLIPVQGTTQIIIRTRHKKKKKNCKDTPFQTETQKGYPIIKRAYLLGYPG